MPLRNLFAPPVRFGALLMAFLGCWLMSATFGTTSLALAQNVPVDVGAAGEVRLPFVRQATPALDFVAGDGFTCALSLFRQVYCWGEGGKIGTIEGSVLPVRVPNLGSGVLAIDGSAWRSCAVTQDATVSCWGHGEASDGVTVPTPVEGLSGVRDVAVGNGHGCALLQNGGVRCWGANAFGQVGNGNITDESPAVDVIGLSSGVAQIALGFQHSCALLLTNEVRCWGGTGVGEVGDGGTTAGVATPVTVVGLDKNVFTIAAGGTYSCALLEGGEVRCWGAYFAGDGVETQKVVPTTIEGLADRVIGIDVGDQHSCALLVNATVQCWGYNDYGQLGNSTTTSSARPIRLSTLTGVSALHLGATHSCASLPNALMKCWGDNRNGQLGIGIGPQRRTPVTVDEVSQDILAVEAGGQHSCLLLEGGFVRCWGVNEYGQVGDRSTVDRYAPSAFAALDGLAVDVALGEEHSCALLDDGRVQCWGRNTFGQLGNGSTSRSTSPVAVGLTESAKAIALGSDHSCALLESGGVQCWGANTVGQLGNDNDNEIQRSPVAVVGLSGAVEAIVAGGEHTCALLMDGTVQCWGSNAYGQLGNGSTADSQVTPVMVSGLNAPVVALRLGGLHSCALLENNRVQCWGSNVAGQSGGDSHGNKLLPTIVNGLGGVVEAIDLGHLHSCALLESGDVQCWGSDDSGQVGNLANGGTPATVTGLSAPAQAIAVGNTHSCAFLVNGDVQCWGNSSLLGDGIVWFQQLIPVDTLWSPSQ